MKRLGETSPFHWFTNPRRDKSVYFQSWCTYLLFMCWLHTCDKFQKGIKEIFLSFQGGKKCIEYTGKFFVLTREIFKFW